MSFVTDGGRIIWPPRGEHLIYNWCSSCRPPLVVSRSLSSLSLAIFILIFISCDMFVIDWPACAVSGWFASNVTVCWFSSLLSSFVFGTRVSSPRWYPDSLLKRQRHCMKRRKSPNDPFFRSSFSPSLISTHYIRFFTLRRDKEEGRDDAGPLSLCPHKVQVLAVAEIYLVAWLVPPLRVLSAGDLHFSFSQLLFICQLTV